MKRGYKNLRECVFHNPLGLANLEPKLKKIAGSYLPFSTGIEIECSKKKFSYVNMVKHAKEIKESIPNLMAFRIQGEQETDFRIPNGIEGLVCLYRVLEVMKQKFLLNPKSGIHYHVDLSHNWDLIFCDSKMSYTTTRMLIESIFLRELDTWNYTGSFNTRGMDVYKGYWIRLCSEYKTIEFRIGEMSFDYEVLAKRIIHCNSMVSKLIKAVKNLTDEA